MLGCPSNCHLTAIALKELFKNEIGVGELAKGSAKSGNSRIRFIMLEADLSEGDLSQVTSAIQNALRPPAASPQRVLQITRTTVDRETPGEELVEGEEFEEDFLEESTPRKTSARSSKARTYKSPDVVDNHLRQWAFTDSDRIAAFNAALSKKYPKKCLEVLQIADFDELKEFEFLELCQSSKLLSKNLVEMLKEKLKRRNAAAHPSSVRFTQAQADDVITDLITNVVARLK